MKSEKELFREMIGITNPEDGLSMATICLGDEEVEVCGNACVSQISDVFQSLEENPNSKILRVVNEIIGKWQSDLGPDIKVILGGSLVSGLFILDEKTKVIDVDVRFLTDLEIDESVIKRIEEVTGLKYRKTINVSDWPSGQSAGVMIEGKLKVQEIDLPLDVEGCLRNSKYIGWARIYREVLTMEELESFKRQKALLRDDMKAYKALKQSVLTLVQERAKSKGLV